MNYEKEYVLPALKLVEAQMDMPPKIAKAVRLAISVIESHGSATAEEMRKELGENWVLARRTKRIVERYGEDVKCYSQKAYETAERRAIERRAGG